MWRQEMNEDDTVGYMHMYAQQILQHLHRIHRRSTIDAKKYIYCLSRRSLSYFPSHSTVRRYRNVNSTSKQRRKHQRMRIEYEKWICAQRWKSFVFVGGNFFIFAEMSRFEWNVFISCVRTMNYFGYSQLAPLPEGKKLIRKILKILHLPAIWTISLFHFCSSRLMNRLSWMQRA